jgi:hypothetical protein
LNIHAKALLLGILIFFAIGTSFAQAPIDPSLPDAPLAHHKETFLFAGYGSVMNPHRPVPPLSAKQKYELFYRKTFDSSMLIRAGVVSLFDEGLSVGPDYGPGMGGFGKLYAYNAVNIASANFFSVALIPSLVHQDPRFFRKGTGSAKSRIWWAVRSQFVAFSDSGTPMPNYGSIIGLPMATALSAAYLPAKNVSFGQTMEGIAIKIGVNAGLDTAREFGGLGHLAKLMTPHKKSE